MLLLHAAAVTQPGGRVSDFTTCIDCGGVPCLESACKVGVCQRDQMVAEGQAAGLSVMVPAMCERERIYQCEHLAERRLLRCVLTANSQVLAPVPSRLAGAKPPLPSAAVSLAAGAPQVYPPKHMMGVNAPRYFTVPHQEERMGITYDKMKIVDNWNYEWVKGGQREYFLPKVEYTRNLNYEAAKHPSKAGYGLNAGQWMAIFTLLFLNGDPKTTKQMLLPLLVIGVGQALMPALMPENTWANYDHYFPPGTGLTRTYHNQAANPEQKNWPKENNWP